jgi:CheY-like chemotaxis protein
MSKILIIEDEEAIADLEKDYLELSGFDVEIETRGDRGLTAALQKDFDLVVLDLMLPGIDGFDVCRKIREQKDIPILMVSAKKDDIDKIRGLGLGADDYMTKPFSPSELVARVKAHMARYERLVGAGQKTNDVVEIRGLKIDKTARRVFVDGTEKILPPRNSTCSPSWPRTPTMSSARMSSSAGSGTWTASETSRPSPSTSRRSARRSSSTPPIPSTSRPSGVWATALRSEDLC